MDHADSLGEGVLRAAKPRNARGKPYLTMIGCDYTAKNLHESRLTRAVFACEGVDFTGADVEVHTIQGKHAGVPLGDSAKFDQGTGTRSRLLWHFLHRVFCVFGVAI